MLRIVVCVSGGGTNLQAILDAVDSGKITNTEVIAVISNNPGAKALTRAENHGIPAVCMSPKEYGDREAYNQALTDKMKELQPDIEMNLLNRSERFLCRKQTNSSQRKKGQQEKSRLQLSFV